jgi:hypothetical protein
LKEHAASTFRAEEQAKQETSMKQATSRAYSSTLTMKEMCPQKSLLSPNYMILYFRH